MKCVHFIGFKGDEYWSAIKIWGKPHFIHRKNDIRAQSDIDWDCDIVVYAAHVNPNYIDPVNGQDNM